MTATTITKLCGGCGVEVLRELPSLEDNPWAAKIAALGVSCDRCAAEADRQRAVEDKRQQDQQERERTERRFKESGLPRRHRVAISSLDHPPAVLAAATQWATDGGGLMLTGEIGRGKTTIAGAACWTRLQSRPTLWASTPLLFARLGSGFQSEQRDWALEVLSGRRALILDDIDKARPTEYGAEQVFLAIDQRVEHEVPLLVTTNLSPGQLAEKWPEPYGEAIASRLVGYCEVVRVDGTDRRLESKGGVRDA